MEGQSSNLTYSSRFYKYVKTSAITNVTDAFVELITNSHDAYIRRGDIEAKKYIECTMDYATVSIQVIDYALGLTTEDMIKCFGQVGEFTSVEDARGYFSRGAKDITALGNATFTAIKDGKISQVTLTHDDIFTVVLADREVTSEQRAIFTIPENGLHVSLSLKSFALLPESSNVQVGVSLISNFYALRDVVSDPYIQLQMRVIHTNGTLVYNAPLVYDTPEVEKVLIDEKLYIQGYPETVYATFTLYLLRDAQPEPLYDRLMKFGIIVSAGNAIHEVGTFYNDARYHPAINRVYGRLDCTHINTLMYDFDRGDTSDLNPFPILDNSRLRGLDRKHPFTKALFRQPHRQLLYVLEDIYQGGVANDPVHGEMNYLLNNLNLLVNNIFRQYLDQDQLYKLDEKANRLVTYHKKREHNVVVQNEESEYQFDNMANIHQSTGDLAPTLPHIVIKFVDDSVIKYAYRIYQIYSQIHLDINSRFTIIKDILSYIPETNLYKILDFPRMVVYLTDIITEALTRHILLQREQSAETDNTMQQNFNDLFNNYEKIQIILKPQMYALLSNKAILQQLITNDV